MAADHIDDLDGVFDDNPSLSPSIEDFENAGDRSPLYDLPSQHSVLREDDLDADVESDSGSVWQPPAWRCAAAANAGPRTSNGWYRHSPYRNRPVFDLKPTTNAIVATAKSPSRSRQSSPEYQDAQEDDVTLNPANIPLPHGTDSPVKERSPEPEAQRNVVPALPVAPLANNNEDNGKAMAAQRFEERREIGRRTNRQQYQVDANAPGPNNFIRFAVRAEVQHRTEPLDAAILWLRDVCESAMKFPTSTILSIFTIVFSFLLLQGLLRTPQEGTPVPDLVNVAHFARGFEPQIYLSEHGVHQASALQESSMAVEDLSESILIANFTSAPIIVSELSALSESLKTLSTELTDFIAAVDGDIDSIIIAMDWAIRELSTITASSPSSSTASALDNIHTRLCNIGLLENQYTHVPTALGVLVNALIGPSSNARARQKLQVTFHEFVTVLEESIANELVRSANLMMLFKAIDNQFLNLQRTVVRENDAQDRAESELLASLWSRIMGPNAIALKKFEKNRSLLASLRARTTENKHVVLEHNSRLMKLKASLEDLRKKLAQPLLKRRQTTTTSVDEQIKGLKSHLEALGSVRETQRGKVLQMIYGTAAPKTKISVEGGRRMEIER